MYEKHAVWKNTVALTRFSPTEQSRWRCTTGTEMAGECVSRTHCINCKFKLIFPCMTPRVSLINPPARFSATTAHISHFSEPDFFFFNIYTYWCFRWCSQPRLHRGLHNQLQRARSRAEPVQRVRGERFALQHALCLTPHFCHRWRLCLRHLHCAHASAHFSLHGYFFNLKVPFSKLLFIVDSSNGKLHCVYGFLQNYTSSKIKLMLCRTSFKLELSKCSKTQSTILYPFGDLCLSLPFTFQWSSLGGIVM